MRLLAVILPLGFLTLLLFMFVAMAGLGTWALGCSAAGQLAGNWQTSPGVITTSHLFPASRGRYEICYVYHYDVNGQSYTGSYKWSDNVERETAEALFHTSYAPRSPVDVTYNAARPDQSYVATPPDSWLTLVVLTFLLGMVFLVLGALFLLVAIPLAQLLRAALPLWQEILLPDEGDTASVRFTAPLLLKKTAASIVLVPLLVVLPGLGIRHWLGTSQKNLASADWDEVAGLVTSANVRRDGRTTRKSAEIFYVPEVTYQYTINDREYESQKVATETLECSYAYAVEIATRFPAGQPASVYVNPADPADSVLLTDIPLVHAQSIFQTVGLAFLALQGVLILLMVWLPGS